MAKKGGLGRGLDSLIPIGIMEETEEVNQEVADRKAARAKAASKTTETYSKSDKIVRKTASDNEKTEVAPQEKQGATMLKVSEIEPNSDQPRKDFDEDALQELAASLKQHGMIQPLVVQRKDGHFVIIAGERRWRAAKIAGLKEVPVVIGHYTDREVMEISLIENIQREDLNAIEEAMAYQRLIQEFHLKQEDMAARLSKSRSLIANTMRLLKLDGRVQTMLVEEEITSGHGRALLPLEEGDLQYSAAQKVASESLSVRETEKMVKLLMTPPKEEVAEPEEAKTRDDSFIFEALEEKMKTIMGTKVSINKKDNKKGRIEIEYYSPEELERIVELIETIRLA